MKKPIIFILIIAALLGLIFFLASPNTAGQSSAPQKQLAASALSASENSYDFGNISMKNGKVSHIFTIKNEGVSETTISRLSTSCMCTEAFLTENGQRIGPFGMPGHGGGTTAISAIIPAGESRELEVVFDPAAHGPAGIGKITRAVFIEDENNGTKTIEISAAVTP